MQRLYALLAVAAVVAVAAVAAVSVRIHAQSENLIAQKDCAVQAEKFFRDGGYGEPQAQVTVSYANHFNVDQGKCFVVITTVDYSSVTSGGGYSLTSRDLIDAFEAREYGLYIQSVGASTGLKVVTCSVTLDGKERRCSSWAEWQALAAHYMG